MATPKKFSALLLGGFPWTHTPIPQEALPFGDGTVIDRVVGAYRDAGARALVLAIGPHEPALDLALEPHHSATTIVRVTDNDNRLGAYLKQGLEALDEQGGVIAIGLCDMALLTPEMITRFFEAYRESGQPVGAPACQGILGHPIFLLPELKRELLAIGDRATHRDLLMSRPDDVAVLPTDYTAVLRTIEDFPDYQEMLAIAGLPPTDLPTYRDSLRERIEAAGGTYADVSD